MRCPDAIANEPGRQAALDQYGFTPGVELPSLQPIVDIAARMFDVPAAAVNMIGSDEVFFAASTGIGECDMRREISFCAHAITQDQVMVIEDAELDPRFHDNPLVEAGMIRFYAGVPLYSPTGHALGALCIVDGKPRPRFGAEDRARLRDLGEMVLDKLELRRLEAAREATPPRYEAPMRDMDQRLHEDELYRLATSDSLTGLPNRNLLTTHLETCLAGGGSCALVMIDLDGFKDVNDTLGHAIGDAVLHEIADRLAARAGNPADMAARIGGDEFAILLGNCRDADRLTAFAEGVIADIARPIQADGYEVCVAGSCGLALAPLHGNTVDELMGSADLALFQAKTTGRGASFLFVPALRTAAVARRMYDAELRRAVERGEFELHYQPQFALDDGTLAGAETLIRWRHPERGLLQPEAFLPALEGGPLAATVGSWAIATACAQAAIWRRPLPDFRVGVNLFAAQFRTNDLAETVRAALAANGLPGHALELEITENIVLGQEQLVLPQLEAVRAQGVQLAFDDFGTGYASLNLLKSYPISHIKIDKSFVQAMESSASDRAIVASLIDLSHELGLHVIAEGVETAADRDALARQGCEEGQGHLFGKAVPVAVFAEKFLSADPAGQTIAA